MCGWPLWTVVSISDATTHSLAGFWRSLSMCRDYTLTSPQVSWCSNGSCACSGYPTSVQTGRSKGFGLFTGGTLPPVAIIKYLLWKNSLYTPNGWLSPLPSIVVILLTVELLQTALVGSTQSAPLAFQVFFKPGLNQVAYGHSSGLCRDLPSEFSCRPENPG